MKLQRNVTVRRLPRKLDLLNSRMFFRELEPLLKADQPALVFDFCEVRRIDSAGVEMLLQCLDAVMKRDGDLKLAALPPEVAVVLELTRADRLFEVFATVENAVESYQAYHPDAALVDPSIWEMYRSHDGDGFESHPAAA